MNWRILTIINAIIAFVTVSAVIFDLARPRTDRARRKRLQTASQSRSASFQSNSTSNEEAAPTGQVRIESADDLANARVDDLGAVPAAALTDVMIRATPEQLAEMARKFNDAPTDARTFGGMGIFFQAWAQLDPKAALAGAFRVNDIAMRRLAARTVVNSVSPSAAEELIGFLSDYPDNDLDSGSKDEFMGTLVSNWSQLDPAAASRFIDQMADTKKDRAYELAYRARSDIAYNWATLDPSAALEWAARQDGKNSGYYPELYDYVIRGWCRKDINSASAYVAQHLDSPSAEQSASSVVTAMFNLNVEDARDWINQLPQGSARNEAESRMASLWSAKDPSSAANWLATLPVNEQTNLAGRIAARWVDNNWTDASRWIATLTGDARDEALAAAVNRNEATPIDSLSLALSIGKEEMRNDVIENFIRNWAATDPTGADTWVKASPLSNEQRDRLLSVISEMQRTAEVERTITVH
ncbi:MAG: hypothetical protein ACM3NN_12120 [Nitrospirota bacterium]